jgi:hypothetical protein
MRLSISLALFAFLNALFLSSGSSRGEHSLPYLRKVLRVCLACPRLPANVSSPTKA